MTIESTEHKESNNLTLLIASVSGSGSGSVCQKCGCTDYEEWEELEYEKGGDDPMYGGALVQMKFTRCCECD